MSEGSMFLMGQNDIRPTWSVELYNSYGPVWGWSGIILASSSGWTGPRLYIRCTPLMQIGNDRSVPSNNLPPDFAICYDARSLQGGPMLLALVSGGNDLSPECHKKDRIGHLRQGLHEVDNFWSRRHEI